MLGFRGIRTANALPAVTIALSLAACALSALSWHDMHQRYHAAEVNADAALANFAAEQRLVSQAREMATAMTCVDAQVGQFAAAIGSPTEEARADEARVDARERMMTDCRGAPRLKGR